MTNDVCLEMSPPVLSRTTSLEKTTASPEPTALLQLLGGSGTGKAPVLESQQGILLPPEQCPLCSVISAPWLYAVLCDQWE